MAFDWNQFNDYEVFAGMTGLKLPVPEISMGDGILLKQTFSRFAQGFSLVNTAPDTYPCDTEPDPKFPFLPPLPPPQFWQLGGREVNVVAELIISIFPNPPNSFGSRLKLARLIIYAIRLYVEPSVNLQVVSTQSFGSLMVKGVKGAAIIPFQDSRSHFQLQEYWSTDEDRAKAYAWVKLNWLKVIELYSTSKPFRLGIDTVELVQFIPNSAAILVALWGAIEALFSPSNAELKFRVSSLLAAYMHPPGEERLQLQKRVGELYDKRSAAAHGSPKHEDDDVNETFSLLRLALIKMVNEGSVPTKDKLNKRLFGVE